VTWSRNKSKPPPSQSSILTATGRQSDCCGEVNCGYESD
jgi:hypothetical protein